MAPKRKSNDIHEETTLIVSTTKMDKKLKTSTVINDSILSSRIINIEHCKSW